MVYVVNDIHGSKELLERTLQSMSKLNAGDILVINGDGAGARGPIMNQIVKIFYEVRRGETAVSVLYDEIEKVIYERPEIPKEWIYDSVHAGVFRKLMALRYPPFDACMKKEAKDVIEETLSPISGLAKEKGIRVLYVPGNGEIVPDDFVVDDITVEKTVGSDERFYQLLADDGYFQDKFGVEYVKYAQVLLDGVLLLSTHMLDLPGLFLESLKVSDKISKVLVHYPPGIAPVGGAFDFCPLTILWRPPKFLNGFMEVVL